MDTKITMRDFRELKDLPAPPEAVKRVAGAILALLGLIGTIDVQHEKDPRLWKFFRSNIYSSKLLGQSLISRMANFDPKSPTTEQVESAKRFVNVLNVEKVSQCAQAAVASYLWVCEAIKESGS